MADSKKIIEVLNSWKGTKWMHGVALKGYRADCGQFVVAVAKELGWIPEDHKTQIYNRQRALHCSEDLISAEAERLPGVRRLALGAEAFQVGDILVFKTGRTNGHVGFYIGEERMIHCSIFHGVEEVSLKDPRSGLLTGAWRRED